MSNNLKKTDAQWKTLRDRATQRAFANRTDAVRRTGAYRLSGRKDGQ